MSYTLFLVGFLSLVSFPQAQSVSRSERLESSGKQVVNALHDRDMDKLAKLVHPVKGVRFSPYEYAQEDHRVFTSEQITGLMGSRTQYAWGERDGSGTVIRLTFPAYYARFVYDRDFLNPKAVDQMNVFPRGHTINNIGEFYPQAVWTGYHFPSTPGRNDWKSLWLVFEEYRGQLYLVGIVHGEWTI